MHRFALYSIANMADARRKIFRTIYGSIVVFLLIWIDPFGLAGATAVVSQVMIDRLNSVVTGAPAADQIAVILIDRQTLKRAEEEWPPSPKFWADLIEEIAERAPKAIYINAVLSRSRSDEDDVRRLVRLIETHNARRPGTILLADHARAALTTAYLSGSCARADRRAGAVSAECAPSALIQPLRKPTESGQRAFIDLGVLADTRLYPFHVIQRLPVGQGPDAPELTIAGQTPAARLAELACTLDSKPPAWCNGIGATLALPEPWRSPRFLSGKDSVEAAQTLQSHAILPQWSIYSTPTTDAVMDDLALEGCRRTTWAGDDSDSDPDTPPRWLKAVGVVLMSMVPAWGEKIGDLFGLPVMREEAPETVQSDFTFTRGYPCHPFPVFSAVRLLFPKEGTASALERALSGRIVLVGATVDGVSDPRVPSPIHGHMPAVIWHAVALESLLRSGAENPRVTVAVSDGFSRADWIEFLVKAVISLVATILAVCLHPWFAGLFLVICSAFVPVLLMCPEFVTVDIVEIMLFGFILAIDVSLDSLESPTNHETT